LVTCCGIKSNCIWVEILPDQQRGRRWGWWWRILSLQNWCISSNKDAIRYVCFILKILLATLAFRGCVAVSLVFYWIFSQRNSYNETANVWTTHAYRKRKLCEISRFDSNVRNFVSTRVQNGVWTPCPKNVYFFRPNFGNFAIHRV
jgi:hypothetical protein